MFNFCGRGGRVRGRLLRTRGLSPCLKVELLVEPLFEALDGDADLLHGVAHADGHRVVAGDDLAVLLLATGLEVVSDAERRTDLVLAAVAAADCPRLVELAVVLVA